MAYHWNRLDELVLTAGLTTLLTEYSSQVVEMCKKSSMCNLLKWLLPFFGTCKRPHYQTQTKLSLDYIKTSVSQFNNYKICFKRYLVPIRCWEIRFDDIVWLKLLISNQNIDDNIIQDFLNKFFTQRDLFSLVILQLSKTKSQLFHYRFQIKQL